MAVIIPPGYAQVLIRFGSANFDGGNAIMTLGFGGPLGDDPTSLAAYAEDVATSASVNFLPLTDTTVILESVEVIGTSSSALVPIGLAGSLNDSMAPPNVSVLAAKTTALRGRRARGRTFLPFGNSESQIDERGNLSPGHRTAIQEALDDFVAAITDPVVTGVEHVVLQGDEGVTPPISPPPPVTAWTVQSLVASQRRRLRR